MTPKEIKYKLHYYDVRGDFFRPPHGSHPSEQVLAQSDQRFGKRCRKLIFKMAAMAAILDFPSAQF